jgi:hypothetical protein
MFASDLTSLDHAKACEAAAWLSYTLRYLWFSTSRWEPFAVPRV